MALSGYFDPWKTKYILHAITETRFFRAKIIPMILDEICEKALQQQGTSNDNNYFQKVQSAQEIVNSKLAQIRKIETVRQIIQEIFESADEVILKSAEVSMAKKFTEQFLGYAICKTLHHCH